MLPKTHLQQVIPQRLTELRKRIHEQIWSSVEVPYVVSMSRPRKDFCGYEGARKLSLKKVRSFPFTWGRKWEQAWFRLELPRKALASGYYMLWDDEGEATLYVDGLPWYGFDAAHHRAPLPEKAREIWVEGTCSRTGVWLDDGKALSSEGSVHRGITFWKRNEEAWETYWDLCVLVDLLEYEYKQHMKGGEDWNRDCGFHQPIFRISPLFRRIMRRLDAFADRFDHEGFKAAPMLKRIYRELPADSSSLKGILTGHAHIDLVWLWPERIGDSKAVHTFSTANRLMEMYPEFHFGYSQPASYDAVERRSPELMKTVRKKIRSGQWETTGASDVESDTQLPCGEALARGFIIGQERFEDLRGSPSRTLWLPDVFGYSPCLPQILKQTGVPWFFTTKLTWSSINRFPYSSFRWRGHDGSEVLVHVSQEVGYNGAIHLVELKKMEECQQEAGIHNEFLIPTGFGDGGGGATPEILERARRVKDLCGLPRCEWGKIEDFFERLEPLREDLPIWQGELYLEYHRGVQTTHGDYKAAFRGAERALQLWEAAHAVCEAGPIDEHPWRRVIFCQFHDAIPGSSIREVYEEQIPELEGIIKRAGRKSAGVFGKGRKARLFNPLPLSRKVITNDKILELPPLSCVPISEARQPEAMARATSNSIGNDRLKARFNRSGELTSLTVDGRKLDLSGPANQLWIYPDHPHAYPAWDIDRGTLGNGKRVSTKARVVVEKDSGAQAVIAFSRPLTERSSVVVRYILEAESPVLQMEWELDWQDENMLLKSVFPTGYKGRMARFGAPFGSTLRTQQPDGPRQEATWEVPGSRWATLSDDGEDDGLSVITEAKYGFTAFDGTLGLSLVRSAPITDSDKHPDIRDLANENPISDIGHHHIRAAVTLYHDQLPRDYQPAALADLLYQPAIPVAGKGMDHSPFLGLEGGDSLVPVWTRPLGEGTFVVRLNETLGKRGSCKVKLAAGYNARLVDLLGKPMKGLSFKNNEITFEPYVLVGLEIRKV